MSDEQVFEVPQAVADKALVDDAQYQDMYARSIGDAEGFWAEHGRRIDWIKPYTKSKTPITAKTMSPLNGMRTAH